MTPRLKPWQHASLAAALTAVTSLILYVALIQPAVASRQAFNARIETLQRQAAKFDAMLARRAQLAARVRALETRAQDREGLLPDKPQTLAAADLQAYLNTLVRKHGGELLSAQPLKTATHDVFPGVTVKLQMRCHSVALQRIFYELGYGRLALSVDAVNIQRRNRRAKSNRAEVFDVRVDVTGYIYRASAS